MGDSSKRQDENGRMIRVGSRVRDHVRGRVGTVILLRKMVWIETDAGERKAASYGDLTVLA